MNKIISTFSRAWTESQMQEGKCGLEKAGYRVYNMDSVEYRHLYHTIIFTMVRSMAKAMLTNFLTVPWLGNFLLLSTNWPILIIWVRHVPWYAYFFPKSASRDKKYQVFFIGPVGCQCKWRGQEFILNETVFLGSKQSWSGMKNVLLNN